MDKKDKQRISEILVKYCMPTRQIAINEIVKELDRAREEGRQESWKECEEFYGDMRKILRPYHMEAEDYRTTLKRLLKLKPKKMESKIEKIKPFHIIIEKGSEQIAKELINASDKINEIIDHLNTQPQTEETLEKRIANAKPHSLIPVTEEELKQLKEKDTPEEWEDRIQEFFDEMSSFPDEHREFIEDGYFDMEGLKSYLKELLEKKELRGWNKGVELEQLLTAEFFDEDYADIKRRKELEKELSKLNKKK